jgi:hypothetical protein
MGIDGNNAWLCIVNVIAKMLMKGKGNGCIYFVILHTQKYYDALHLCERGGGHDMTT